MTQIQQAAWAEYQRIDQAAQVRCAEAAQRYARALATTTRRMAWAEYQSELKQIRSELRAASLRYAQTVDRSAHVARA